MSPARTLPFHEAARLPLDHDNVAIAVRRIDAGTTIQSGDRTFYLPVTVMEGHRFAVQPIAAGSPLLSWGLPFGYATVDIAPGQYVCNQGVLDAFETRRLNFELPAIPNFRDYMEPYALEEDTFAPADQVPRYEDDRTFSGFWRSHNRGAGTRNYIVLLGTTSLTGSFVRQLEARFADTAAAWPNVDGVVAVAHTEGAEQPNNLQFVLRTLAGFMVHPNVGAVMAVDYGVEPINNQMLRTFMAENDYPLNELSHRFVSLSGSFLEDLDEAEHTVREWLPVVSAQERTPQSVANLRIALQCGGSDAFSGISGNPLVAWVAREIIRYGGAANLAETDELIGAEPYILQRVRDLDTAYRFLAMIERFKERVAWHGHTAEHNPTGGNKYRGLYNIALKSIGAARKKNPDVRLDYVLDYGERMRNPGYHFMNSPGNDIESIAGQVASGSNLIAFVTGNGSVTNFPFVPTIKVVTTSKRYQLLKHDMDVNAGEYLDGTPMDTLGKRMFALTLDVASGQRSIGEKAGHSQVQLWRNWRQTDPSRLEFLTARARPAGKSLPVEVRDSDPAPAVQFRMLQSERGRSQSKTGVIVPTSLCSSEVAKVAAARLNENGLTRPDGVSRFIALTSTEGCGNSSGVSEELYVRTILGYVQHPIAEHSLFLEHGCEKTHNDYMHAQLRTAGIDPQQFGWASVQMDGGIDASLHNVEAWFANSIRQMPAYVSVQAGLGDIRLGIASMEPLPDELAGALAHLTRWIVSSGGTVVTPQNSTTLSSTVYRQGTIGNRPQLPTLAYGDPAGESGFHIMETPTSHWVETVTGLGATGVECIVAPVSRLPLQAHPLVPVIQISTADVSAGGYISDIDLVLDDPPARWAEQILTQIVSVAEGNYVPKFFTLGNVDFQITRGLLGVSM